MIAIQKVVECLEINKDKILNGLANVIRIILSNEAGESVDRNEIQKKIENMTSKSERLLDLYLSEDLTKEEYRKKKEEYENKIAELHSMLTDADKEHKDAYDSEAAIKDITSYINNILSGNQRDEIFYQNIVEKIVVYDRRHMDIYLRLLPYKWKVALNSALEADDLCGSIKKPTSVRRSSGILK